MGYIRGLDLNVQLEMEANKAAIGGVVAMATTLLAANNFIPQEFAGVKSLGDVMGAGLQMFAKSLFQAAAEEQQAAQTNTTQSPPSTTDVVGF